MATGAVKRVRAVAQPGSVLAACITAFNALLSWADQHSHAAIAGGVSSNLASQFVPMRKVTDERGLGPKGAALTGTVTTTVSARNVGGYGMSATEYTLVERIWERLNAIRDLVDAHTHSAAAAVPGVLLGIALVDVNGRDPNGVLLSRTNTYRLLFQDLPVGPESDQLRELIVQINNFSAWYDAHAHSANGAIPTVAMSASNPTVSKIADPAGYDAGALVTA